jgi:nucleoside-diphosphate-sugar epimerase
MKNGTEILVTGGSGFIGSYLVEKLTSRGALVTVADNFSRNNTKRLDKTKNRIRVLNLDLRVFSNALKATRNQQIVFNLAAINTGIDFDFGKTQYMFEENMLLQMMPIRAAAVNGVKKFIQVSSSSIYSYKASVLRIPTRETDDNETPEQSKLGYSLAKKMGENLAKWYSQNSNMKTVISRFTNVYGLKDNYDNKGHFISAITKKFMKSKNEIEVFGSGNQKRSFLHVSDAVDALIFIASKGENGEPYNVDPHDEHTIKEIVYKIREILGSEAKVIFNKKMPEGPKRRLLDNKKIIELGWKPKHRLLDELPDIIREIYTSI